MPMDYLTEESEVWQTLHAKLEDIEQALQLAAERIHASKTFEHYLTGDEICLHISTRTLQTLRDRRSMPFTMVGERTILYPESKLYEIPMHNYRPERKYR